MNSKELIKQHEGLRLKVYQDTKGIPTIGYGHNLRESGKKLVEITKQQADELFEEDYKTTLVQLSREPFGSVYNSLNTVRKAVLENMMFNMGPNKLAGFAKMLEALRRNDYVKAHDEMLDSKWVTDVGNRAKVLAKMMLTGAW